MIIRPTWSDLQCVVESATETLLVCTPFFTDEGIGVVFDHMDHNTTLHLVTRLSPSDWRSGVSDPESLLALLDLYDEIGMNTSLHIHQRLHAKAYIANQSTGLIGSANLSGGGFQRNFELMYKLSPDQAYQAEILIRDEIATKARIISIGNLQMWVDSSRECIYRTRAVENQHSSDLAEIQKSLDILLQYGGRHRINVRQSIDDMELFVDWLRQNQHLLGSDILLEHHENLRRGNRTGHFKQCFFIVSFFYEDHTDLCQRESLELGKVTPANWSRFPEDFITAWVEHLTDHAIDIGEHYSYPTLRASLSPSLGGTVSNGGGASGTLKRMFRLLSRYLQEA